MAVSMEMSLARRSQLSSATHAGKRHGRRSAPNAERGIAIVSNSHDFVPPRDEAERAYLESLVREDYERCHAGQTLDDITRCASFSTATSYARGCRIGQHAPPNRRRMNRLRASQALAISSPFASSMPAR